VFEEELVDLAGVFEDGGRRIRPAVGLQRLRVRGRRRSWRRHLAVELTDPVAGGALADAVLLGELL